MIKKQSNHPLKRYCIAFFTSLLFAVSTVSSAESHSVKGSATIDYQFRLSSELKKQAKTKAIINALKIWTVNNNINPENYDYAREKITQNLDDYVLSYQKISHEKDKSEKTYTLVVKVRFDETRLLNNFFKDPEITNNEEYITFVFVARENTGLKKIIPGQSREKIRWDVSTTNEINTTINDVFSDHNLFPIDANLLERKTHHQLQVSNFVNDYRTGNDLSSQTLENAVAGLSSLSEPIRYLAVATLDILEPAKKDPISGNYRVLVTITAKVMDTKRYGAIIASVEPTQYAGLGENGIMAKNNALKSAGKEVAIKLASKLTRKKER